MTRQGNCHRTSPIEPSFKEDYLDVDGWPHCWRVEAADLRRGEQLLDIFKPFLFWLLDQGLSRKTLRLHRDHLCDLGGELIRQLNLHPKSRRQPTASVLLESLDDEGGPLIYPRKSEPEQRSFDSTCKKLHCFLLHSKRPPP
jgi:hypothetical protein